MFCCTETKAAVHAAMVKKGEHSVWQWRKEVIENNEVFWESQQGRTVMYSGRTKQEGNRVCMDECSTERMSETLHQLTFVSGLMVVFCHV